MLTVDDMDDRITAGGATVRLALAQSRQIDAIALGAGALRQVPDLVDTHFGVSRIFLVGDENTMAAAGSALEGICSARKISVDTHVFPGKPRLKALVENAQIIIPRLKASGGVAVAVGSGVVNDLVKYAAFQAGVPYICVATAASMDGYASAGSSLTVAGFKHTLNGAAPRVVVADLDIIANAPGEMSGWGYGDLAGKLAAGADWLIADALGIEKIDGPAWNLVQNGLRAWLADPAGLANGKPQATQALFTGLIAAGVAMEVHGTSRPASGADHQIAHMWEMDGLEMAGVPVAHGACVAIGTLSVLALYEWLLGQDLQSLDAGKIIARRRRMDELKAEIDHRFAYRAVAERALQETRAKFVNDDILRVRIEQLAAVWPRLRSKLADYLISYDELESMLTSAGVATDPATIGIDAAYHKDTVLGARLIRRRYTILDFLDDIGLLEAGVDEIFSNTGRWGGGSPDAG